MTVMKWMFWIVPMLELVGRAHGQQTVQIQVQPQVVGQLYSRRPGDDSVPGAALRDRNPHAGADQLGGSGRPGFVFSGAFGS